jgi:NitT/TauT family transport system ATP-binding protein
MNGAARPDRRSRLSYRSNVLPELKAGGAPDGVRPAKIEARSVWKIYDTVSGPMTAVENFTIDVADGEFVCIVGPSGCGKSTFLRMLAGLDTHSAGQILIRPGKDPKKPLNNVVFQEYAVFPWKTVIENVAFGLQMRGIGRAERLETANYWLERVGLRKFANYYPSQISGGMKQRVSIVRALANDPEVLLMDEPLGALDAQTRIVLQDELLRIWEETRKTVVYITHSLDEAILLGDRVILMTAHPGRLLTTFHIGIERPRTVETLNTPEFAELRGAIWAQLAREVSRAMEMQE